MAHRPSEASRRLILCEVEKLLDHAQQLSHGTFVALTRDHPYREQTRLNQPTVDVLP